jgi:hypothetical protein
MLDYSLAGCSKNGCPSPFFPLPEWNLGMLRSDKKAATLLGVTASGAILELLVGWTSCPF